MSDSLRPQQLQHARRPCPSRTLRACSNSCPLSWWCHQTISSRRSSQPRNWARISCVSCITGRFFTCWAMLLSSVQFSLSVVSDSLWPHGLQHARLPCLWMTAGAYSTHVHRVRDAIPSSSVIPFSSCLQSFPASGSFLVSQFVTSSGQSIGVSASASVLQMNIQEWFP